MTEEINIANVENFITIEDTEISDISKIIQQMLAIKSVDNSPAKKKTKPYSIDDKITLNGISSNLAMLIEKYHVESYHIVEEAIACLSAYEPCIGRDLYDYYFEKYIEVLDDKEIGYTDMAKIKTNSDDIYKSIITKIKEQIYMYKKSEIPINKQQTYISAITAYVFYKCKFLIPIEK